MRYMSTEMHKLDFSEGANARWARQVYTFASTQ